MKRRGIGSLALAALCLLLMACGKGNGTQADFSGYTRYGFQEISGEGIISFTVRENGEIVISTLDGKLSVYGTDGALIEEKDLGNAYWKLCCDGECLYAYDYSQSAIVELGGDGAVRVVEDTLPLGTIRNMVALDGKLYMLAIPASGENGGQYFGFGGEEFEDNGGVVYCVDIESGGHRTLGLEHIMAEYRAEDGTLYFYGWQEDKYYLYTYDPKKDKVTKKQHQDSMGNMLSIVAEGGYLFGMIQGGLTQGGLVSINLEDGEKEMVGEGLYALFGNDLQFREGNLLLNQDESAILHTAFIGQDGSLSVTERAGADAIPGMPGEEAGQGEVAEKRKETIALSMDGVNMVLDEEAIQQISGMRTKVIQRSMEYDALLTELMAGNEDVDFYFFSTGYSLATVMKSMGYYVPLNASEKIAQYLDGCFGHVREAATAENGDIWMFPLYGQVYTTWYVPENMERFGLGEGDLDTVGHYLDTLERLQGKLGDYRYYNLSMDFIGHCEEQYSYLYYGNRQVDFRTDAFRDLMQPLWDGWELYSEHPLFYNPNNDYFDNGNGVFVLIGENPVYDTSRVVFKTIYASNGLYWRYFGQEKVQEGSLEGWRVMEAPKIRDASDAQGMDIQFAVINPYSKQKEAAIAYLEAIVSDPDETILKPSFLREDVNAYAGKYDITKPAFLDLYEIHKNTGIMEDCPQNPDMYSHILEYQQGKISFDQAAEKFQRAAEMGLYE